MCREVSCLVGYGKKKKEIVPEREVEREAKTRHENEKMYAGSRLADKCLFPDVRGLWFLPAN